MPQADRRTDDEIKRDLATEEGRGGVRRQSPIGRLTADVAPLLAEVAALRVERDALRDEVDRLREIVNAQRARPDLRSALRTINNERRSNRRDHALADQARAELAAERARHETTRAKVRAVELLHCWTNEDGRRFVFADDLAVALEIPGAAAASPSPVAGPDVLSEF